MGMLLQNLAKKQSSLWGRSKNDMVAMLFSKKCLGVLVEFYRLMILEQVSGSV